MLPMDVGLVALGLGWAPFWVLGQVQPCSTVSCTGNGSGMECFPTMLLPAASAVASWVSVSASAVTTPFLGVSGEGGREGSSGVILSLGESGAGQEVVMDCKSMAKLMCGSMWW